MQVIIDELPSVFTNYSEKVLTEIKQLHEPSVVYLLKTDPDDHTPFTTIGHDDLWITNIMINKGTSY